MHLSWIACLLVAIGILILVWITFGRVPRAANRGACPPDRLR